MSDEFIELPEVNVYDKPPPIGEVAAQDRYSSVLRLPEQVDTRMSDALYRMGAAVEPDRVIAPDSYKPAPAWATGLVNGLVDYTKRPGQTMERNPYKEGTEEASWWEDQKLRNEDAFARETALNTMGTGAVAGVPVRAGETVLGAGAVRGKAPKMGSVVDPAAKFPQYAERYPDVGPPVELIDKKTKQPYLSKQLTPEAQAFGDERTRIMADMKKNGFTPYFDPAQRTHVDPQHYPANVDTTTLIPKKQATIDKHMEKIDTEESRGRLRAAYERGSGMQDTADWYAMAQLEKKFIDELGPVAGRKAFQDKVATSMAATTGGADPTSNWLMATYGNYLRSNDLPYPKASYEMPYPIGGRYVTGNMAMHQKIFDQGGFSALGEANPKRHNFSQNFTGNRGAATMDEQMTSGMTPNVMMPPPGTYGLYEKVLADEAKKVGVHPQNYQDVGWAGFKNMKDPGYTKGQPFIQTVNESIERTHRLTGMPRDEIVRRGIVKGEIPMYGIFGAVGLGAVANQQGDR